MVRLGIDTHQQAIAYMRRDCHVCRSEGFNAMSRVELRMGERSVIATLDVVDESWLEPGTMLVLPALYLIVQRNQGKKPEID